MNNFDISKRSKESSDVKRNPRNGLRLQKLV